VNTFFTDRDLGRQFPKILSSAGILVQLHDDLFGPTTPDAEWLGKVGERGWFVLTHDQRIRYKPNERDAVMNAGVGMFVLVGQAPHRELAENFVATRRQLIGSSIEIRARSSRRFIAPHPAEVRGELGRS
jgi:hypothetical protein